MNSEMCVVVIGGLHHNTLGVVRSLGEAKIHSESITLILSGAKIDEDNMICKSKYLKKSPVFIVPNDSAIIPVLESLAEDQKKRIVICCSDGSAEVVMRNYDKLKTDYFTPSCSLDIGNLMDKQYQNKIAVASGFSVPVSDVIDKHDVDIWNIYPCITKPVKSVMGGGKADIHISDSKEDLFNALNYTKTQYVQIQQFIKKKMEFQLIGCSLNGGEEIIIPGFTKIIRQPDNTNTGYLKYSPISELKYNRMAVNTFIKTIGYSGLFSLEFIRDEHGQDFFLEINMRNDGNAYCVKSAGVNLPYVWCYSQAYGEIPKTKTSFKKSIYFMPEFFDIKRGIKEVGVFKWIAQFFLSKSHAVFNWKDMKPFLFTFSHLLKAVKQNQRNRADHK
ncbi:hypothetical protein [Holdemania massiliensis]|uniref:hypothetical protein n=1 Tax=Holdemania massiliensis TaxID=1468449 RepID=UPI001F05905F|nr:hypothetical protein [Holdemania massiliensis]MCH1940711.1 hypothetical protein [Holdemania massiliensis]